MHVSVVQLSSGLDVASNTAQAVKAVETAAAGGARLVVLPEASMYGFGDARTDLRPAAEALDGPFVRAMADAASRSGTTVVAGMFEPAPGPRVFNTVVVVGPDGLRASYRKLHLYDALGWCESERVAPGDPTADDALVVVGVGEHRVGVLTCYDLRFPEIARALADRGATMLVVPAAWVAGPGKVAQWSVLLQARAIENAAYVAAAGQPEPAYSGHSAVVDPTGEMLAMADGGSTTQVAADCPIDRVAAVRRGMPVLENRRFAVVPRP